MDEKKGTELLKEVTDDAQKVSTFYAPTYCTDSVLSSIFPFLPFPLSLSLTCT